jgi:hypothetical protein
VNTFQFGLQTVHTKVNLLVPRDSEDRVNVVAGLHEPTLSHEVTESIHETNARSDVLDNMSDLDVNSLPSSEKAERP